MPDWHLVSS